MPRSAARRPPSPPPFFLFPSRRSTVHSTHGIVACTQPLAASIGARILRQGGTAADAAVAAAAALNVTEPTSTGIGGDVFCLYYDATTKTVEGLNASGRSPRDLSLARVRERVGWGTGGAGVGREGKGRGGIGEEMVESLTVPGAAAGWADVVARWGSGMGLAAVLAPAVELAEGGAPIAEVAAHLVSDFHTLLVSVHNSTCVASVLGALDACPRLSVLLWS